MSALLKDRDGYKGDMIEDANKYYTENVEGKFDDSSSNKEKIEESKTIKKGSRWLYLEESKKEVITETKKVVVNGMEYKAKEFKSKEDANKWLEKNKDWGVIKTEKGKVYVAKNDDKGKKVEKKKEISENVNSASEWL